MKQQRNTRQRQIILKAVKSRVDHPTADQIYFDVRQIDGNISRGTVYRNLKLLALNEEVMQVKIDQADRYDWRVDLHYHLVCSECGMIEDVPLPYHGELDNELEKRTGYLIERHRTIFTGVCPQCRRKKLEENRKAQKMENPEG